MKWWVGTSGFGYREWRGKFYPADCKPQDMLSFYAERFPAVEINASFYRMPAASSLRSWLAQAPEDFVFTFKAPALITHRKRLRDAGEATAALQDRLSMLGPHLGPILFQLPPHLSRDIRLLSQFLDDIGSLPAAFEFRHPSWFSDEVYALLRERQCALCISERDDAPPPPLAVTAAFGYIRLRRGHYTDSELQSWKTRATEAGWRETFVFFRHEETASGPAYVRKFLAI
ncbi:MAG: DUF72 domain-containing protein [Desulfuromonadales bacterium]